MRALDFLAKAAITGALGGLAWASIPPALVMPAAERARTEASVTYAGCNEVRAAGKAPLSAGQPGYRETMDGDGDGIACEGPRF